MTHLAGDLMAHKKGGSVMAHRIPSYEFGGSLIRDVVARSLRGVLMTHWQECGDSLAEVVVAH